MGKQLFKPIKTLAVLSSLLMGQSYADVLVVGNQGEIANKISSHFKQELVHYSGQQSATDILYVDVASATESELSEVRKSIINNGLVVLDLTNFASDEERKAKSKHLTGIGVSSPVVINGLSKGESVTNLIEGHPDEPDDEATLEQTILDSLTTNFDYKG
ncbi:hypothetical protein IX95_25870 [Vibrio sp. B183]|uniref:hypothetical protein n=1 Tax=Vibrio sp. B183 TaxID=1526762 RepID=UPI000501D13A|nr:hypothetical protein [Vibrio sp. B183]KFI09148.1 hypothetical protein IX95_25870 [Vibrio sp. B183]